MLIHIFEQLVLIIVDERIIRDISKVEANYFAKNMFLKERRLRRITRDINSSDDSDTNVLTD